MPHRLPTPEPRSPKAPDAALGAREGALGFRCVAINAGQFRMGSSWRAGFLQGADGDELPQRTIQVSAFALMTAPVTRALYRACVGEGPEDWDQGSDQLPANGINWWQAVRFCNMLSIKLGLEPCYRIKEQSLKYSWEANGYRLPCEAEWEYACRAGTTTPWFCRKDQLRDQAWFGDNSGKQLQEVKQKTPNPWGLYDMAGNVWEWCWDRYGLYPKGRASDPRGPETGEARVLRGGSYHDDAQSLRSAARGSALPEDRVGNFGFRCLRGIAPE